MVRHFATDGECVGLMDTWHPTDGGLLGDAPNFVSPSEACKAWAFSFDRGECDEMQRRFGIQIGNTWGSATAQVQQQWSRLRCDEQLDFSRLAPVKKILLAQCQPKVG
jgi:hypothetical protein